MSDITPTIITIVGSIVGLAMVAVVMSRRAQTPQVIQAGGTALASVIGAAVSPLGSGNAVQTATNNNASSFGAAIAGGLIS